MSFVTCQDEDKVDSITAYGEELQELEKEIYHLRSKGDEFYPVKASAFVSFPDILAAQKTMRGISNKLSFYQKIGRLFTPRIEACPRFEDLIWENLGIEHSRLIMQRLFSLLITVGITVGWTFLVAFVTTLTNITTIAKVSPELANSIQNSKFGILVLQSVIAPLVLVVLNILLPIVLRALTRFQGVTSVNGVEQSVLQKYYGFQVYQILVYIGLSSIGPSIQALRKSGVEGIENVSRQILNGITIGFVNVC